MYFASDGPLVCASNFLPPIDHNFSLQVTFISARDQYQKDSGKQENVCQLSVPVICERLKVLTNCNELFIENKISIEDYQQTKESINDHNKEADETVIVTLDHNACAMDMKK